jgi:hypothetical protein
VEQGEQSRQARIIIGHESVKRKKKLSQRRRDAEKDSKRYGAVWAETGLGHWCGELRSHLLNGGLFFSASLRLCESYSYTPSTSLIEYHPGGRPARNLAARSAPRT